MDLHKLITGWNNLQHHLFLGKGLFMLFQQAIGKFANYKAVKYQKASTDYASLVRHFQNYIKKPLNKVDNDDIIAFQNSLKNKYQDSTQAKYAVAIRAFFEFTNGRGWTTINLKEIDVPRIMEKIPVYVVESEFETLCDKAKDCPTKLLALRLLWFCGVRVSELCDIMVGDLNLEEKCAKIQTRKSFRPKTIFWDDQTNNLIRRFLHQTFLFENKLGQRLTTRSMERWINGLVKEAKINKHITPHSFRHGMAHSLLDMGMDLPAIQDLLGHKHPQSVFKYTRRLQEDVKEKAREAIRKRQKKAELIKLAHEWNLEELLKEA